MLIGFYLLLSLPGLATAFLVRRWARSRKFGRSARASLFALTIGILCSPGLYVAATGGAVAAMVVPSLLAVILARGDSRAVWTFVISSFVTTAAVFVAYDLASKTKRRKAERMPRKERG